MKKLESDLDESDEEEAVIDDDDETDFDVEPDLIAKSTVQGAFLGLLEVFQKTDFYDLGLKNFR